MGAVDIGTYCGKFVFKGVTHETLGSEMVNLIRLHFIHDTEYAGKAFQRCSMENELVDYVLYPPESVLGIFDGNSPNNAMNLVPFSKSNSAR